MSGPRRVLVTGAGGFVGANLTRRLLADGHDVTATVRPGAGEWRLDELDGQIETVALELADPDAIARLVSASRPEWVFHLGAHGAYSWQRETQRILAVNVLGTAALADACAAAGCERLVHAGSSSEYGFKDHAPAEDEAVEPNSAYAVGKAAATHYLSHLATEGALDAVTLRLYSVYGAWEDPRRLVPTLIARGLDGALPPLVDPDTARDYVAVDDVVEAFVAAARATGVPAGAVYNVGTGRQTAMREIVDVARAELDITAEPDWGTHDPRSWDATTWVADPSAAHRDLGWSARCDVAEGFRRTVQWLRSTPSAAATYGVRV